MRAIVLFIIVAIYTLTVSCEKEMIYTEYTIMNSMTEPLLVLFYNDDVSDSLFMQKYKQVLLSGGVYPEKEAIPPIQLDYDSIGVYMQDTLVFMFRPDTPSPNIFNWDDWIELERDCSESIRYADFSFVYQTLRIPM